jgi:Phage capsid family
VSLLSPELRAQLVRDLELIEYETPGQRFSDAWFKEQSGAEIRLHPAEVRALITTSTSDTPAGGVWLGRGEPYAGFPQQRLSFVADLLYRAPTSARLVPYVRAINTVANEGGASAVAEASAKPEATLQWQGAEAPAKKVAVDVPATREIRDDARAMQAFVDGQLLYLLRVRLDQELLSGSGSGEHLLGLLNDTAVPTVTAGANPRASVTKGLRSVEDAMGQATGVAVHPDDFWNAYDADVSFWGRLQEQGVQVVRSPAMTLGRALVGDFQRGATLLDRDTGTVRTSESHADYFVRNILVILAELSVILQVTWPTVFADVTL